MIAFLPFSKVRIFFYRIFLGYKISYKSKIGPFNLLLIGNCEITDAVIGMFNKISCKKLVLSKKSRISKYNRFSFVNYIIIGESSVIRNNNTISGTTFETPYKNFEGIKIGNHSTITNGHAFDCADSIEIGSKVIVGGSGSQFWTHGFTNDRVKIQGPIIIEDNIYIGSRCMFMPAIRICTDNVIAGGTTVSKSILESGIYASSKLIKISDVKKLYNSEGVTVFNNSRYIRKEV